MASAKAAVVDRAANTTLLATTLLYARLATSLRGRGLTTACSGRRCAPPLMPSVSNCLESQVLTSTSAGDHEARWRTIALRITSSFRMHAVSATFCGLPAARSR